MTPMKSWKGVQAATCLLTLWTWPWHVVAVQTGSKYEGDRLLRHRLHRQEPEQELPPDGLRVVGGRRVPDDFARKLWDGLDLTQGEQDQLQDWVVQERVTETADSGASGDKVQLLAPPDSGSNLIASTLLVNWPERPGKNKGYYDRLVFKHSISNAKDLCKRYLKEPENFTVVVVLRSPISQLVSWHNAPYFLRDCTGRGYDEMGGKCFANGSPEWNDRTFGIDERVYYPGRSLNFSNAMDVYNRYATQYKEMRSEPACSRIKVQLVHYEDMVFTPGKVMEDLARTAGWPVPSSLGTVDAPAKHNGPAVGREAAMKKIASRGYLEGINAADRAARCKELNADLVRDQFERSYSGAPISYLKDCQIAA